MTMNDDQIDLFDEAVLDLEKLPAAGRHVRLQAEPAHLETLTRLARVSDVGRFAADVQIAPIRGGYRVTGTLVAEVTQPCVVTLDPVTQSINEPLDRVFLPEEKRPVDETGSVERLSNETVIELSDEELPDYYSGNRLNLNNFLVESLGLAIDLYPRRPGASLPEAAVDADESPPSPFAVLKSLDDTP